MKKEEILEASRYENKMKDAYEYEIDAKACRAGAVMMLILALIFYAYEIAIGKGINNALYSLITVFNFAGYGYKAIKVEKSRKLNTIAAIVWGLLTILLMLDYFKVI